MNNINSIVVRKVRIIKGIVINNNKNINNDN